MTDGVNLINNIKKIRIQNNKTQEELARMLDISLRSYQNIESNKSNKQIPNVITAIKLAKILNTSVENLYIID